jgi:hypothetical protein
MTDLPDHTQGRRPTGVMSTGFDGNVVQPFDMGARNVRLRDHLCSGEDCCMDASVHFIGE